jgi:hypothetical protein
MRPEIAKRLFQYASEMQSKAFKKWCHLGDQNASEDEQEAQRLVIAAWAEAAQELYNIAQSRTQERSRR